MITSSICGRWIYLCEEKDAGRNQDIARRMFSRAPQLETVAIGSMEWQRDRLDAGEIVEDKPDEWKHEMWWNYGGGNLYYD